MNSEFVQTPQRPAIASPRPHVHLLPDQSSDDIVASSLTIGTPMTRRAIKLRKLARKREENKRLRKRDEERAQREAEAAKIPKEKQDRERVELEKLIPQRSISWQSNITCTPCKTTV